MLNQDIDRLPASSPGPKTGQTHGQASRLYFAKGGLGNYSMRNPDKTAKLNKSTKLTKIPTTESDSTTSTPKPGTRKTVGVTKMKSTPSVGTPERADGAGLVEDRWKWTNPWSKEDRSGPRPHARQHHSLYPQYPLDRTVTSAVMPTLPPTKYGYSHLETDDNRQEMATEKNGMGDWKRRTGVEVGERRNSASTLTGLTAGSNSRSGHSTVPHTRQRSWLAPPVETRRAYTSPAFLLNSESRARTGPGADRTVSAPTGPAASAAAAASAWEQTVSRRQSGESKETNPVSPWDMAGTGRISMSDNMSVATKGKMALTDTAERRRSTMPRKRQVQDGPSTTSPPTTATTSPPTTTTTSPPTTATTTPQTTTPPTTTTTDYDDIRDRLPANITAENAEWVLNERLVHAAPVQWDDIAGLDHAKAALREAVVYPVARPDLFSGLRQPLSGLLLFGPPGTGKTALARAAATAAGTSFFAVSAGSILTKWLGESEQKVRALFAVARACAPSVIFVDEIDAILASRADGGGGSSGGAGRSGGGGSGGDRLDGVKTEFLVQWSNLNSSTDGLKADPNTGQAKSDQVLVLAATNMPWKLDDAAIRRFGRRQYVPLPGPEGRKQLIERLLSGMAHSLSQHDLDVLVKRTEGFSGSDLNHLMRDAAMGPVRDQIDEILTVPADKLAPVSAVHIGRSLELVRPSVRSETLDRYADWAKQYGEYA